MILAGGASTNSRSVRPLPLGAVRAITVDVSGVYEVVRFEYSDGHSKECRMLSWVGGQAGLLFGAIGGPFQFKRHWSEISEMKKAIETLYDTSGSYGHVAEHDLADALGNVFNGHLISSDMACRFFANGGDACAAAVRIARAATGRDRIATQGYHGAHADFAHEPHWAGYAFENVRLHLRFEFGDVLAMRRVARNAACIMVEVPAWDDEDAITAFLRACRDTADEYGIPFIVDDVVCGMRLSLTGSIGRYGTKPDIVILGKALSAIGGVSAIVGRADLVGKLADEVFFSTTFGGAPGPCAVAAATVKWLMRNQVNVYGYRSAFLPGMAAYSEGHLRKVGIALKGGLNALGVRCVGQPERFIAEFDTEDERRTWCSKMIERGVMVDRPFFPTLVHTMADVEQTLRVAEAVGDVH